MSVKSTIFISYAEEDSTIASILEAAIKNLEGNQFVVFRDRSFIEGGTKISEKIYQGLDSSFYFVAIGTDVARGNFSWCGLELGYFTAVNRTGLITCLYHDKIPDLFHDVKCFQVVALNGAQTSDLGPDIVKLDQAPLREFLTQLANEHQARFPAQNAAAFFAAAEDWADRWTDKITQTYFDSLQTRVKDKWYPQGRIEVSIPNGDFFRVEPRTIPDDATVHIESSTYLILGAGMPTGVARVSKSWADFNAFVQQQTGGETLARLIRDVILSVLPNSADAANDHVLPAPNGRHYRIILIMHQIYGNKRREFVINMIPTLARDPGGDPRTTTISAGIMLATRYRSMFLEDNARWRKEALKDIAEIELPVKVKQLLKDLDQVNADGAAEGLSDMKALQDLLGESEEVKEMFDVWWKTLKELEGAARDYLRAASEASRGGLLTAHANFVDVSKRINQRFIALCLDAYQRLIA